MNESRYQLAINIFEFQDDMHSILLKSRFDVYLECQVTVLSAQKQPGCKKGAALFKMTSMKKVVKSKGWPRNGCDGIG